MTLTAKNLVPESGRVFRPRDLMEQLSETDDPVDRMETILLSMQEQGDGAKMDPKLLQILVEDGLSVAREAKKNREAAKILEGVREDILAL